MRIDFNPYGMICTDNIAIYDVYFIIVDEKEKTLDVSDNNGFSIALIHYENEEEVECLLYDHRERLTGESIDIIKNGKLVYKNDNN